MPAPRKGAKTPPDLADVPGGPDDPDVDDAPVMPSPTPLELPDDATPEQRLTAALSLAQGEFPPLAKSHTATVTPRDGKAGYSYTYADLADVLATVRPVLARHGLAVVQRTEREQSGTVLVTELKHIGGGVERSDVDLGQSSSNPQQFGGALTYLRRYELTTLLGLAAEEDRDAQDVDVPGRAPAPAPLPAWAQPLGDTDHGRAVKAALLETLTEAIGDRDVAREYAGKLATLAGGFPAGVGGWLAQLPAWRTEAQRRARDAAAGGQAQAGETPDTPTPDPAPDPEPASDFDPVTQRAGDADTPDGRQDLDDEVDTTAPPVDEPLDNLDRQAQLADGPAPGTVPLPIGADGRAPTTDDLRAAGCTCKAPGFEPTADDCPLEGHGIPF